MWKSQKNSENINIKICETMWCSTQKEKKKGLKAYTWKIWVDLNPKHLRRNSKELKSAYLKAFFKVIK